MIVCRKCSRRHADDTEFCDCGAYLPFDGEHVVDPAATAVPRPAAPEPTPPPVTSSSWGAVEPAARAEPRRPPPAGEPAPWSGFPGESTWSGPDTSTTVPTPDPPASGGVDARLPDEPDRDVAAPVWVEPTRRAGDVACARCGAWNEPTLQFCRHCGQPLAAAGATTPADVMAARAALPWWRRLGRSARARAGRLDADGLALDARRLSAPGGLSSRVLMFRAGGVAVVVVALLAFLGPWRSTVVNGGRTLLGGKQYVAIPPNWITPTVEQVAAATPAQPIPLEVPQNVTDRFSNTAWATRWLAAVPAAPGAPATTAPPVSGVPCGAATGTDSYLRFAFAAPTDIDRVSVLPGRYSGDKARGQYSRPRTIDVQAGGACKRFVLPDKGELQPVAFSANGVNEVDVRIVDVYPGQTYASTVEISEVVFERRR